MANPGNSQDAFGIGNLINQFKGRAREVVRQANAGLEPLHVQQVNRYIQDKQDKAHQLQHELGGRIQKSVQELGAQLQRKDAGQEFAKTDGLNVFRPVFAAAHATYEATPLDEVQEMIEDGTKAVEHRAGEALKEGVKQANENFRKGLRQAGPSLQALDRNIGAFDRGVHQIVPGAPHLKDVSHAIDEQRLRNRQTVHDFWMRDDLRIRSAKGCSRPVNSCRRRAAMPRNTRSPAGSPEPRTWSRMSICFTPWARAASRWCKCCKSRKPGKLFASS